MTAAWPRALGGGPLIGDHIVRFIYLDESGTGDPAREPNVVVAAVIVHADKQLRSLGKYLSDMADAHIRPEDRQGFVFHATELYSGGKILTREKYPKEQRWAMLDELATVPRQFDLPVVFGTIPRAWYEPGGDQHEGALAVGIKGVIAAQMLAFTIASVAADYWMDKAADADEIAQMVMENNPEAQQFIRKTHKVLADPKRRDLLKKEDAEMLAVSRIIETLHFEEKSDSSALQVADYCAWAIRRRLSEEANCGRFCNPLLPQMVNKLKGMEATWADAALTAQPS